MLARTAYQPAGQPGGQKPQAQGTSFQAEPVRQTVKASPAVRVELSDAARSALLGLQEIAVAPPPDLMQGAPRQEAPPMANSYVQPGSRLNLSI